MIEKGEIHWADAFVCPFFILKESASFKIKNAPQAENLASEILFYFKNFSTLKKKREETV